MYPDHVTVNGVRVPGSPMTYLDGQVKVVLGYTNVSTYFPDSEDGYC